MKKLIYIGNQLQKFGYNPTTIDLLAPLLKDKFTVYCASDKRAAWFRLVHMLFTVLRFGRSASYVLIDVYSTSAFLYFILVVAVCKFLGVSYIPILHGGNLPQRFDRYPKIRSWSLLGAARVVSPSLYLKNYLETHKIESVYIPNFIDFSLYTYKHRDRIRPRLLWVRSFHQIYNPELAVRVLERLSTQHNDCQLAMVGPDKDGTMSKVIDLAKSLGVDKKLLVTGKLDKSQWIKLSESYDIFINTTSVDNMPVSLIEAMALGLPVVSTKVGGLKFMIDDGENGLLVEANDVLGFCKKINQLIENNGLREHIAQNAYKSTREYSQDRVLLKWFSLLQ